MAGTWSARCEPRNVTGRTDGGAAPNAGTAYRFHPRITKPTKAFLPGWPDTGALWGAWLNDKRKCFRAPYKQIWIQKRFAGRTPACRSKIAGQRLLCAVSHTAGQSAMWQSRDGSCVFASSCFKLATDWAARWHAASCPETSAYLTGPRREPRREAGREVTCQYRKQVRPSEVRQ